MQSLHLISLLLQYPSLELQAVAGEIRQWLTGDPALPQAAVGACEPLLTRLATTDIYDCQEAYVDLFDRGRAHSLHLFEHVHGESRDRGQAMVDLRARYLDAGLEPEGNELPDYLPLFLEYLSVLPSAQAAEELAQPGVILSALADRLDEKGTPYAAPMRILADLAGAGGEAFEIAPADDPDDLAALDAAWEEEQIRFDAPTAPGSADCPQVAGMVDRMLAQEPVRSHAHG